MVHFLFKKRYSSIFFLILLLSACVKQNNGITSEVIPLKKGFGYVIKINNKTVIKQSHIPAVDGNIPFCTKEDARRTAKLVTKKLIENKSPAISLTEIEALGINFKCVHLL